MEYEWDVDKAKSNFDKHGVHFADAVGVFEDEFSLWQEDVGDYEEQRFVIVGMDFLGRILTVVFTYGGSNIRLISARKSTQRERRDYEKRIQL